MPDKRKEERIKKSIRSEVKSEEALTFSSVVDLSKGGIFISTPEPLNSGTNVELSIMLPGAGEVTIQGVVKWIRPDENESGRAGMGIEFQNINDDLKKKLGDLIR